jgi:hypothetical protein
LGANGSDRGLITPIVGAPPAAPIVVVPTGAPPGAVPSGPGPVADTGLTGAAGSVVATVVVAGDTVSVAGVVPRPNGLMTNNTTKISTPARPPKM